MLAPPNCCIQVAPHAYRATHCFGTSSRISGRHSVGFGRVLLAGGEHKRRPSLKGNDGRKGRGSRSVRIGAQTQSSVSTSAARNALPVLARP
jgi:hypothetical protein